MLTVVASSVGKCQVLNVAVATWDRVRREQISKIAVDREQ